MKYASRTTRRAFTLIELLVTLSIMALLIGIAIPAVSVFTDIATGQAGQTTISTALSAARVLNHRLKDKDRDASANPWGTGSNYSGTAALFTPDGTIRFTINDQLALSGADETDSANSLEHNGLNGYKDIEEMDDISLPNGTNIVGVIKAGGTVQFLLPPFALRFDENGQLATDESVIYYDSNADGVYDTSTVDRDDYDPSSNPPNTAYNLTEFLSKWVQAAPPGAAFKPELPFEEIEVVSSVILYDRVAFENWLDTVATTPTDDWSDSAAIMAADGFFNTYPEASKTIHFSPQTGIVLRD